ncbi:hydrogen peroxide-dependent heme synthase [Nesterenkonia alkaliphila]|uniref:Coproheme decarboxylase n=1 Tax=Nesterenkonia alkaliphila TaxID=1463631 RepID=A0A7K1UGZ7_9MICC|nr:hydrogen peroxide-dependent heme synthase [Nesterenkonia alkaliphila]MVT25674.1 chlorite dismutase [Nesterenkonia alkaliphila]GFZ85022.1 chlorite dismutase [Nesterenkonia alkaliphila]
MSYGRNPVRSPEEVNASGKDWFTLFTVFKRTQQQMAGSIYPRGGAPEGRKAEKIATEFDEAVSTLAGGGLGADEGAVVLRGAYDVSAMRADADIMLWLTGHRAESLQAALRRLHRTELLNTTEIAFSAMGVHRTAEFARGHVPAFSRGVEAEDWLVVYPFNRSYDWYLMDPAERGRMLREHGMLGQEFPSVLANTTSAFALNDWEWLLALEAPQLTDLVDMMRKLRESETRYHVRDETPFYTGRRLPRTDDILEVLA